MIVAKLINSVSSASSVSRPRPPSATFHSLRQQARLNKLSTYISYWWLNWRSSFCGWRKLNSVLSPHTMILYMCFFAQYPVGGGVDLVLSFRIEFLHDAVFITFSQRWAGVIDIKTFGFFLKSTDSYLLVHQILYTLPVYGLIFEFHELFSPWHYWDAIPLTLRPFWPMKNTFNQTGDFLLSAQNSEISTQLLTETNSLVFLARICCREYLNGIHKSWRQSEYCRLRN